MLRRVSIELPIDQAEAVRDAIEAAIDPLQLAKGAILVDAEGDPWPEAEVELLDSGARALATSALDAIRHAIDVSSRPGGK